jgi:hypothetical protein
MNSITAAKNRRANGGTSPPMQEQTAKNAQPSGQKGLQSGLTLPQVIQIVDMRLTNLEKSMGEIKISPPQNVSTADKNVRFVETNGNNETQPLPENLVTSEILKGTIDEFDKRYELLAEEIIILKNIILNLQSYTMDVNKLLVEERARILEELDRKHNDATTLTFFQDNKKEEITPQLIESVIE